MKTIEDAKKLKMIELRCYAKTLGIKNINKFSKDELAKMIIEILTAREAEKNDAPIVEEVKEVLVEEVVEEKNEDLLEIDRKLIAGDSSFFTFVEKYDGKIDLSNLERDRKITIAFSGEKYKDAVQEYKESRRFKTNFYCFDNYLHTITLYPRDIKRKREHIKRDRPLGEQSLAIYNMIIEHPNWTHYKIKTILNCTYTNVRRVYLSYIKGTSYDTKTVQSL